MGGALPPSTAPSAPLHSGKPAESGRACQRSRAVWTEHLRGPEGGARFAARCILASCRHPTPLPAAGARGTRLGGQRPSFAEAPLASWARRVHSESGGHTCGRGGPGPRSTTGPGGVAGRSGLSSSCACGCGATPRR